MSLDPNPSAFPLFTPSDGRVAPHAEHGMELRDYFAAKAMHAELLSAGSFEGPATALAEAADAAGQTIAQRIAFLSYEMADAMLKQRILSEGEEPIHG